MMSRWTPLILMAGGLAILLGTLLGINFPMGQQANMLGQRREGVLPANINVNSTANRTDTTKNNQANKQEQKQEQKPETVAQSNQTAGQELGQANGGNASETTTTAQNNQQAPVDTAPANNPSQNNDPVPALW